MVTIEMKKKARQDAKEALEKLGYPELFEHLRIEWNSRFSARMGDARYRSMRDCRIRLSEPLWPRASEEKRRNTVIHEICHIVVAHEYSFVALSKLRPKPHGPEWQAKMRACGEDPKRCHSVPTAGAKNSRRHHVYHCNCEGEQRIHRVGNKVNANIQRGQYYSCRRCKGGLRKPGQPEPKKPKPKKKMTGMELLQDALKF